MFLKQVPLLILLFIACNSNRNAALNDFVSLYDGKFSLENGIRSSLSSGKENYLKLLSSNNSLVEEGWLLPAAMANNCAILLFRSNPVLFEGKNILEVEIQINDVDPLTFKYHLKELELLRKDYESIEAVIMELVKNTLANNMSKVKTMGYETASEQEQNFISFFDSFREAIPENYKETKLVGYTVTNMGVTTVYSIDAVLITQDNFQKMINVSLVRSNNQIKIKEVKF